MPSVITDADGQTGIEFLATDDPAVKVSNHAPSSLCETFGHDWELLPFPFTMVFNPATGVHLMNTFRANCRRCPVFALVERCPEVPRASDQG